MRAHLKKVSMEQSCRAKSLCATQDIPWLFVKSKVHCFVHKISSFFPILSLKINQPLPSLFKMHFNSILPSTPVSPKWPLPLGFALETCMLCLALPYTLLLLPKIYCMLWHSCYYSIINFLIFSRKCVHFDYIGYNAYKKMAQEFLRLSFFFPLWRCDPTRVMASSFLRFLDYTQRRITVGRTSLDEWSARRRDLYLTTHNTHNRQTSMHPAGFEPTISAGEWPQTYALDRATTGTST